MFMVLIVHSDFWAIGWPSPEKLHADSISWTTQIIIECFAFVCVDVFVLISGWFGIRISLKGFLKFIFQCLFFLVGLYVITIFAGEQISAKGVMGCFCLLKNNWFIKSYIGLYILSPVLNAFVEYCSQKQQKLFLVSFFSFQTIYGWLTNSAVFFEDGYSTMSFIGLYMLARYAKLYLKEYQCKGFMTHFLLYCMASLTTTSIYWFNNWLSVPNGGLILSYISPTIIVASVSLLLAFNCLNIYSKFINWLGASSFAVFLLHTNPNIGEKYFKPLVLYIYDNTSGPICIVYIFVFLCAVFILAVIIDQLRIVMWKMLEKKLLHSSISQNN